MSENITAVTLNLPVKNDEKYVPSEKVANLKKEYRKAQHVSADFRRAQHALETAIRNLKLADYVTTPLEAELELVKVRRNIARVVREEAAAAYHTAKAEEAK